MSEATIRAIVQVEVQKQLAAQLDQTNKRIDAIQTKVDTLPTSAQFTALQKKVDDLPAAVAKAVKDAK